jgi:hypothetical protein
VQDGQYFGLTQRYAHRVDASLIVASIAARVSVGALIAGRYDRWREARQRLEDLGRVEQQRREDLERVERQRREDLERSRPALTVEWNWNAGASGVWIGVNVTALPGRPSTSLMEVGFTLDGEVLLDKLGEGPDPAHARGIASFPFHREITPCEPGQRYTFTLQPLHGLGPFIDPDTELIPYVIDVEGTRHTGPPLAVFARLIEEGWTPPDDLATLRYMTVAFTFPPERKGEMAHFDLVKSSAPEGGAA